MHLLMSSIVQFVQLMFEQGRTTKCAGRLGQGGPAAMALAGAAQQIVGQVASAARLCTPPTRRCTCQGGENTCREVEREKGPGTARFAGRAPIRLCLPQSVRVLGEWGVRERAYQHPWHPTLVTWRHV